MKHFLRVQLRSTDGSVVRALGLMERRGFKIISVTVDEAQGDGQAMSVCLDSDRPGDLIQRQLERLHDVLWVEIRDSSNQLNNRTGVRSVGRSV